MTLFESGRRIPALVACLGVTATVLGAPVCAASSPLDFTPKAQVQDEVEAAINEGNRALQESRWQDAIAQFRRALELSPGNAEALAGLEEARVRLDAGGALEGTIQQTDIERQRVMQEFDAAMQNAQRMLEQQQYAQARQTVITAGVSLDRRRDLLSASEYESRSTAARALQDRIRLAEEQFSLEEARRIQAELEEERRRARDREARARAEQINQNLIRVRELQLEQKYEEALQTIDQILFLDNGNPVALTLKDAIQTSLLWRSFIDTERLREFAYSWQFQNNRESTVAPFPNFSGPGPRSVSGLMSYPQDWPQLSILRTSDAASYMTVESRRVAAQIENTTIHNVAMQNTTLESALKYIEDATGTNVMADWKSLDLIDVRKDNRVSLNLRNVPAKVVLEAVLSQVGDDYERPTYAINDGVLVISSKDAISKHVVQHVYDIRDMLFEIPYFDNAPTLSLSDELNGLQAMYNRSAFNNQYTASTGDRLDPQGRSGRDGAVFSDGGHNPNKPTREQMISKIMSAIMHTVDRESWVDFGGSTGVMQELGGNLIVTQTPRNHRSIQGLLSQLREIRALQIHVESRFLSVDMDWFEKIGFDLDLYFNTNSSLFQAARAIDPLFQLGDFFDSRGRLNDPQTEYTFGAGPPIRTTDGFTPTGITQHSLGLVDLLGGFAADSFAGTIISGNPAVVMGISFLDDIQVDLLIEATQADRRNVLLTAPRLSLFNGQRSWVLVGTQRALVTGLIPIVGDGAGAFQPIIGTLTDGVVLDVEAVISADRRYVTMTVITGLRETLRIETLEFTGGVGGGGIGGGSAVFGGSISLPEVQVSLVNTSASVPDRGTLLIGGQRLASEVEVEVGVPILSKIPFINRFFTNRVTSKKESTLLILLRPEIIIQQENEDLLFPGLSDMLGSSF